MPKSNAAMVDALFDAIEAAATAVKTTLEKEGINSAAALEYATTTKELAQAAEALGLRPRPD